MSSFTEPFPRRDEFTVHWPISTRWSDNDVYGHINNVVHYSWFDTAVNGWLMRATGVDVRELFGRNVRLAGGICPARAYIEELLPDVLSGKVQPGRVFDRTTDLGGVPDGYRSMQERKALKVLVRP